MKNKDKKESYTHYKEIRKGLVIFKRGKSPYWYVRLYDASKQKLLVRSTKEDNRLDAIEVATEIADKLFTNKRLSNTPQNLIFKSIIQDLMQNQILQSGKERRFTKTFIYRKRI